MWSISVCRGRESNPHPRNGDTILSRARLPVPPPRPKVKHAYYTNDWIFFKLEVKIQIVMISATDLKNGVTFLHEDKPSIVVRYEHIKVGRGGATIRVLFRDLVGGGLLERTFTPNNKFDEISTLKKKMQYLYSDGENAVFMNPSDFTQTEIPLELLGDSIYFVKEGSEVDVLFWEDKALSIEIPPKIVLKVVEAAPGVKGNSATNLYKPAKLENGMEIKVPLFIKTGEKIRVDTRTSEYVERASE